MSRPTPLALLMLALLGCGGRSVAPTDLGSADGIHDDASPGACWGNAGCSASEYCRLGGCAGPGQCAPRPATCPPTTFPPPEVCGCDAQTYREACEAARAGVSVAHQGPCPGDRGCEGVTCAVLEDCCSCEAHDVRGPVPVPCPAICEAPACEAMGLSDPFGYCLSGQCFVGASTSCQSDTDCGLVNDCCACMALPVALAISVTHLCSADCFQPSCSARGLAAVNARCVAGRCRLAF